MSRRACHRWIIAPEADLADSVGIEILQVGRVAGEDVGIALTGSPLAALWLELVETDNACVADLAGFAVHASAIARVTKRVTERLW